jgi:two-component system chemotaxis response regulator CheB
VHTVLIVDDSAFMRKLIGEMISADSAFHVIGFARNGVDALRQIATLDPDVVTLDLEMPQLDGMQVLEQVMSRAPRRIVVLSGGGGAQSAATIQALELGAVDFVQKPSGPISLDLPIIRDRLIGALHAAMSIDVAKVRALRSETGAGAAREGSADVPPTEPRAAERVVVIASSTGGPRALAEVIPSLPVDLSAAVLVAQHMPKEFTTSLAERLDHASAIRVREAVSGEPLLAETVYIAPGGAHLRVVAAPREVDGQGSNEENVGQGPSFRLAVDPIDAQSGVSPSADLLFESAAAAFGAAVTAVVLTGMGRDGSDGVRAVRAAGGHVVVQDRETSVIYGMPHAALQSVGGEHGVALGQIAGAIVNAVAASVAVTTEGNARVHG